MKRHALKRKYEKEWLTKHFHLWKSDTLTRNSRNPLFIQTSNQRSLSSKFRIVVANNSDSPRPTRHKGQAFILVNFRLAVDDIDIRRPCTFGSRARLRPSSLRRVFVLVGNWAGDLNARTIRNGPLLSPSQAWLYTSSSVSWASTDRRFVLCDQISALSALSSSRSLSSLLRSARRGTARHQLQYRYLRIDPWT